MPNPTRIEINCETGEVTEMTLTDAEVSELAAQAEAYAALEAEREAEAAALAATKAAVLERLGLTEAEAKALLS